jgi:hypothetical protein
VRIAKACSGTTRLLPVNRGALVLLFRCCRACEADAGKTADTNFKVGVLEAHAKLLARCGDRARFARAADPVDDTRSGGSRGG